MSATKVECLDPSLIYRPDLYIQHKNVDSVKEKKLFRDYRIDVNDRIQERVRLLYLAQHTNQTVEYVKKQIEIWGKFNRVKLTMMEALEALNALVDESDPDVDVPNVVHAFQTAERIRKEYPDLDWFHLTGLIHDAGKVMALYGQEQWSVTGDTYPVGCRFGDSIVYRDTSFDKNPDYKHPLYSTKNGMYEGNCGLDNILMSWGHDEYLYRVLIHNKTTLPVEALYMIRYHSFYPWHTGGDYLHLCDKRDLELLKWVNEFNKFDLYTKSDETPDIEALKPYYQSLIDKYIPGVLEF